jgi:hypothetical protein
MEGIPRRGAESVFTNMASRTLTAGKDLNVPRHGTVAWTPVTMHFAEKTKDGKTSDTDIRIREKHGADWLLVHEHLSAPLS